LLRLSPALHQISRFPFHSCLWHITNPLRNNRCVALTNTMLPSSRVVAARQRPEAFYRTWTKDARTSHAASRSAKHRKVPPAIRIQLASQNSVLPPREDRRWSSLRIRPVVSYSVRSNSIKAEFTLMEKSMPVKAGECTALPQTELYEMIERILMRNHLPYELRRIACLNTAAHSSGGRTGRRICVAQGRWISRYPDAV
jgi:hypothetical protein